MPQQNPVIDGACAFTVRRTIDERSGITRRSWALFAAMCLIWGVPYLLIRVAVRDFSPGTLVFLRTAIGGVILLPFALSRGGFAPVLRRWRPLLAFTVIEVGVPWLLLSDAERVLSSSLSGLLVAGVPLVGVVVAKVAGADEARSGALRYAGLLLGLAGVTVLLGLDVGQVHAGAVLEIAVVAIGYATAPVILSRRLSDLPSIPVITASLLITAIGYLPYGLWHWPDSVQAKPAWSVLVLGVLCTAVAFVVFFALIAAIGPARATVITYVNPAVAVLLGVLLLNEKFTLGIALGFPLILVGSILAARRPVPSSEPVDAGVPEGVLADTLTAPADDPDRQSMRTSPDGVANTAATTPVSSSPDSGSNGDTQSTSMRSSG
jgi:drug/metabolite transporter (DMT)-like permease